MKKQKRGYSNVTPEMLSEFWNHRINPITGYIQYPKDVTEHNIKEYREDVRRRKLYNQTEFYE